MRTMAGHHYQTFIADDGRKVVLRPIRREDLDDCIEFINSLVEEEAQILRDTKVTREEETEWLERLLAHIEKGEVISVVAEIDGRMVANSEVEKRSGFMKHVGYLGIGIKAGYRGIGIGTRIMQTLIQESKKTGLKILVLDVHDNNQAAKGLYTKVGFKDAGRIPKGIFQKREYVDLVRMTLEL